MVLRTLETGRRLKGSLVKQSVIEGGTREEQAKLERSLTSIGLKEQEQWEARQAAWEGGKEVCNERRDMGEDIPSNPTPQPTPSPRFPRSFVEQASSIR